jgi:hypothetical protein
LDSSIGLRAFNPIASSIAVYPPKPDRQLNKTVIAVYPPKPDLRITPTALLAGQEKKQTTKVCLNVLMLLLDEVGIDGVR